MNLDQIKKMIHDLVSQGKTPRTILLTPEDARSLHLPSWTRQFLGMKCIIAGNWPRSEVTDRIYETVTTRRPENDH